MKEMAGFIHVLMGILAESKSFPVFLVLDGKTVLRVEVPLDAIGGNSDGPNIVFRQGRELALQHSHLRRNPLLQVWQITIGTAAEGESVLVSQVSKKTGKIDAIPFQVVRDRKGRLVNLIDTGGIVQVAGTFLFAFLIGIDTSDQPEAQGLQALERKMERLAKEFVDEVEKRRKGSE
jgi:hypothetical protein